MTKRHAVGFWTDRFDPDTARFGEPQSFVDPAWDPGERVRVAAYLRTGGRLDQERGYSWCRFRCGIDDRDMGSRTLTDGTWYWPEGYAHYLEAHGVKPPEEFLAHVRRRMREEPPGA
jgi:hypothetical protein